MAIPNLQSLPSLEDGIVVDQIAQQVINFGQTLLDEPLEDAEHEDEAQILNDDTPMIETPIEEDIVLDEKKISDE
jgi:hypothetical protein